MKDKDQFISPLLTTKQVADILGLKPHTIAVGRSDGSFDLPYVKVNRSVRYDPEELKAFMKAKRIGNSLL